MTDRGFAEGSMKSRDAFILGLMLGALATVLICTVGYSLMVNALR